MLMSMLFLEPGDEAQGKVALGAPVPCILAPLLMSVLWLCTCGTSCKGTAWLLAMSGSGVSDLLLVSTVSK